MPLFIGIDIGTSACRACAMDAHNRVLAQTSCRLAAPDRAGHHVEQDPLLWWQALVNTVDELTTRIPADQVQRIAIDATSATLLLADPSGQPLTRGLMYNDARAAAEALQIDLVAPPDSVTRSRSSSLAKLLHLFRGMPQTPCLALHQSDWLSGKLTGQFGISDDNNALKLGYDAQAGCWPDWLAPLPLPAQVFPEVRKPGTLIGSLLPALCQRWGWPESVKIVAGTTDSTAGFLAAALDQNDALSTATAVTSLGSTLVIKVLSDQPVYAPQYGVYSHRIGQHWLVGGASNAGGCVLKQHFDQAEIELFTQQLKPGQPTGLNYYPLPATGERFPINNPSLQPRLLPEPATRAEYFQGILEGLADIEQRGYRLLQTLGAPAPKQILTVGGGAGNQGWTQIRQHLLGVPVLQAKQQEAAYGTARLAKGIAPE